MSEPADRSEAAPDVARRRGIEPDRFQREAIDHVDSGRSVLVAAPTSSGKTLVAEHAIGRALAAGRRTFYTTPIKALSNQKLHDLGELFGRERVGLMTGDNVLRPDAEVVVMTTEVLRNMIYAGSEQLRDLGVVVLDEIHYLMDPYRGPVWEEVIVQVDRAVQLVCLSATVSNADEIGAWLTAVRGDAGVVTEHRRPVPLRNHLLVGDKATGRLRLFDVVDERGRPIRRTQDFLERAESAGSGRSRNSRLFAARRVETIEELAHERLLPAIYFVFSRAGCDEAARAVAQAGIRLVDRPHAEAINEIVDRHLAGLDDATLEALEVPQWRRQLEQGIGAHHAGLVPPMKEAVEECFAEGLLGVVFATETLAMGVNLPARSVVIESLSKFRGDGHSPLTAGEYTQLTGRAGRRGIDVAGEAVVCWNRFLRFEDLARLASSRDFELRSAFRPTYNMVANLVSNHDRDGARTVLGRSLAQFQADGQLVRLRRRRDRLAEERAGVQEGLVERLGDEAAVDEALRTLGGRGRRSGPTEEPGVVDGVDEVLSSVRPGSVVVVDGRPVVVLSTSTRKDGLVVNAVDRRARTRRFSAADLRSVPETLGEVELPSPFDPGSAEARRELGRRLARHGPARHYHRTGSADRDRERLSGPDRRQVRRLGRLDEDLLALDRRIAASADDLVDRFDRVESELQRRHFLDGWALTDRGQMLAGIYHESDLLVAEAIDAGLLDGLDQASLAALVSCFVYEHRSPDPPPEPWFPSDELGRRFDDVASIAADIADFERRSGLGETRPPDPGFVPIIDGWMLGLNLSEVLDRRLLSPGDFVRSARLVIDLLRQIGTIAPSPLAATARRTAQALDRDLVAATRVEDPASDPGRATAEPADPTADHAGVGDADPS
ncbi:MAG: DEAD/DEAH box helicase [Actinomycetota bacterium]